jgi:SAM-dependent methyltransferase
MPEEMRAEFGTVAWWTREAVAELGDDHAVAAACRGSGSPAALSWLCAELHLTPGTRLLDCGAGVGGPSAFAREEFGAAPVLVDPMAKACAAARSLFGLPAVVAAAERLPFAAASFTTAWCLGVLSTTDSEGAVLHELARVLQPHGRLGVLAVVREVAAVEDAPSGNDFSDEAGVRRRLDAAGFDVERQVDAGDLPPPPDEWAARAARVEDAIRARHAHDDRWRAAHAQQEQMTKLLDAGEVRTLLLSAVRRA